MQRRSKPSKQQPTSKLVPTDTNAGIDWLRSLDETKFRDDVLEHLFRKMKKQGVLLSYQNVHGRNDKGVDFIVTEKSILGSRVLGIQAKSKPITRSESGGSLSSIRIKQECDAAMEHEFQYDKSAVRLDNIELWCSSHVTEDAAKEFNAAGSRNKIQVKSEGSIYSLIETFCPDLIKKIPQCALALYLKEKRQPAPHSLKLLGCRLQPHKHFIEPQFSSASESSMNRLVANAQGVAPKSDHIRLNHIVLSDKHVLIEGQSLSGKSYLVDRLSWVISDSGKIPVSIDVETLREKRSTSIWHLIANSLGFLTPAEAENLSMESTIYVLIDNVDFLKEELVKTILETDIPNVKIIATSTRKLSTPANVDCIYLTGIHKDSIPSFLRSLDTNGENIKPFTDRAYSFITRSLEQSGLPLTPFTFSILLGECETTKLRFTTPTFGRLIQRFVEHQLGSMSEAGIRVDFETKRAFLLKLSGETSSIFTKSEFRKRLIRFIEHSSHPHTVDDFYLDLVESGVFTWRSDSNEVRWSHPVIKKFFLIQNLIKHDKHDLIFKTLSKHDDMTFSALVGSQLGDAKGLIKALLHELDKVPPIKEEDIFDLVKCIGLNLLPDEEQEAALLEKIEHSEFTPTIAKNPASTDAESKLATTLSSEEKRLLQRDLEPLIRQLFDSHYYMAHNMAGVLVNARDTNTELKVKCVQRIVASNANIMKLFSRIFKRILPEFENKEFILALTSFFFQFELTDSMLGDPFLVPVFKKLATQHADDDEYLILLDLLLACGENVSATIIKVLTRLKRIEITTALYNRVLHLYYFRFHREGEKRNLRELLKDMRRVHKSIVLPKPV